MTAFPTVDVAKAEVVVVDIIKEAQATRSKGCLYFVVKDVNFCYQILGIGMLMLNTGLPGLKDAIRPNGPLH
jgi:hypothetical protein